MSAKIKAWERAVSAEPDTHVQAMMPGNILGGRKGPCSRAFSSAPVGDKATPLRGTNADRIAGEGVSNAAEQSQPQQPFACDLPPSFVSASWACNGAAR
jgi:hypothetical protein